MFWSRLRYEVALFVPEQMHTAIRDAPHLIAVTCRGARPRAGGWHPPGHLMGLPIRRALDVHDWMYWKGQTEADRNRADRVLRNNMLRLITAAAGPEWLQRRRRERALAVYQVAMELGGVAFWELPGKQRAADIGRLPAVTELHRDARDWQRFLTTGAVEHAEHANHAEHER